MPSATPAAKGVLVTEAIWTRYQPMRQLIQETLASGLIGEPRLLTANLGYFITGNHRIVVPELAGGALLDVGVYTLNFAEMVFGRPDALHALCTKNENGVDLTDSITLTWQDGRVANLTAAANAVSDRYGVIYGTQGYMMVENINNPQGLRVYDADNHLIRSLTCPAQLTGYEYEVLETVECIQNGLLECPSMPHARDHPHDGADGPPAGPDGHPVPLRGHRLKKPLDIPKAPGLSRGLCAARARPASAQQKGPHPEKWSTFSVCCDGTLPAGLFAREYRNAPHTGPAERCCFIIANSPICSSDLSYFAVLM